MPSTLVAKGPNNPVKMCKRKIKILVFRTNSIAMSVGRLDIFVHIALDFVRVVPHKIGTCSLGILNRILVHVMGMDKVLGQISKIDKVSDLR